MEAWSIFSRATALIVAHLDVALRVSLLPYGLAAAAQLLLLSGGAGELPQDAGGLGGGGIGVLLLWIGAILLAASWIAVGWHRFGLLGEVPEGWAPPLHGALLLGYLGRSVLLLAAVGLAMVMMAIPLSLFGTVLGPAGAIAGTLAGVVLAMIVFYRLSVILPAGAAGRPIGLGDAWAATAGHSGTAVGLALLTVGLSLLLQVPSALDAALGATFPLASALYQIAAGWMGLLVGIAVLTVFYARTAGGAGHGHA